MSRRLFAGSGESARLMSSLDWSQTALGAVETWPASLRAIVPVMLTSPFAMRIQWGPDLVCLYNDGYRPILGTSKHPSAMGRPTRESFAETWEAIRPIFEKVLAGEATSITDTLVCIDRSGFLEECYFTASYSPIEDDEGAVAGVLGVVHETTRNVVSDRRLRTLRDLARRGGGTRDTSAAFVAIAESLAQNVEDVPFALFYRVDANGEVARLAATVGLARGAAAAPGEIPIATSTTWPLEGGDDRRHRTVSDVAARFGSIAAGPYPEPVSAATVVSLVRPTTGRIEGYGVLGVSPRRALDDEYRMFFELVAEQIANVVFEALDREERAALAERERAADLRLRQLFGEAPAAIAVLRVPGLVHELANPHYEALVGRTALVGAGARESVPELASLVWDHVEQVARTGTPWTDRELVAALPSRDTEKGATEVRYFNVAAQPLRGFADASDAVVLFAVEVTELVVAREERTRLLASERAARREAELGNAAKDELLAIVSHELRNPLSAILGWTRLLRTGMLADDKKERALETIERNAVNQAQLVEDLLDASRIIAGKMRLEVRLVTFGDIVKAALDSLKPTLDAKRLRLKAVLATEPLSLMGDASRLQQVVWNVLANAAKFTPRDGSITVVLGRVDSTLELSVTDTGEGIDAEFLPFVFDRFKLADSSSTRAHGGLGLGLSIAKNLVEMHGGTMRAESPGKGKGATFVVKLPVAPVRDLPASVEGAPDPWPRPAELVGLDVLVVDDELDAREMVAAVLEQCGATVTLAGSAAEAIAAFDRKRPEVLLSDVGMPGEDGLELLRKIRRRAREDGGATPAASLTAYAGPEDRRRALDAGFNMHVAKPVDPVDLVAVVANLARLARAIR